MASSPSDGLTLDHSRVSGNATVFDGSTIQATAYARIHLSNGTRLDLGAGSSAQIFQHRTALESGAGEIQSSAGYELDVKSLKILPESANSVARVKLENDQRVLVMALNAPVNVRNTNGMLVARILPSKSMAFAPQAGSAAPPFSGNGCVLQKGTSAIFVEDGSRQVYELRGTSFDNTLIGNRAMIIGVIDSTARLPRGAALSRCSISRASRKLSEMIAAVSRLQSAPSLADRVAPMLFPSRLRSPYLLALRLAPD